MTLISQIEVTTRCNYDCKYCTGRSMVQKDMSWETFEIISKQLRPGHVSLQGEGEPTLWPHLYRAAKLLYKKHPMMTIINGSRIDIHQLSTYFMYVGVSIDTLDSVAAKDIGRHNLDKVLSNVESLINVMHGRLVIHTTDYGQDLTALKNYCTERRLRHVIQPLQKKDDYVKVYPVQWLVKSTPTPTASSFCCSFLDNDKMDFYTVDGELRPCCMMKTPLTVTRQELKQQLSEGQIPYNCAGCKNIQSKEHTG